MQITDILCIENRGLELTQTLRPYQTGNSRGHYSLYGDSTSTHIPYDEISEVVQCIGEDTGLHFKPYLFPLCTPNDFRRMGSESGGREGLDSMVYNSLERQTFYPEVSMNLKGIMKSPRPYWDAHVYDLEPRTCISVWIKQDREIALEYHDIITQYLSMLGDVSNP